MNYVDSIVKEKYEKYINTDFKKDKNLSVKVIENGFVLPVNKYYNPNKTLCGTGGVVDSNYNYIENSAMLAYNMSNRLYGSYKFNKKKVEYIDESVIYINHFIHQWGHYLLDVINRLWYILDKNTENLKFVYTVRTNHEDCIKENYLEILELLGIKKENLIRVNKVTQFKKIIIPEASLYPGKYFTIEYKKIFDRIIDNANVTINYPKKNIYCSRSKFKKAQKKEIGEEKLESIFNENGFESVYFENMDVREQINIINNSNIIVAVSGTIPHNILFARNNPKVVILNKTYKLNLHQFLINQVSNVNADFIDVNISPMPVLYGMGPFIMKVTNNLKEFCIKNKLKLNTDVNHRVTIKEKIWYYSKYLIYNRGRIVREEDISLKEIREFYKNSQKTKGGI